MSDHLPECPYVPNGEWTDHGWVQYHCICDRLRACERRVLDAAREAVAAVSVRKDSSYDMRVQSLAAIDALRGEEK